MADKQFPTRRWLVNTAYITFSVLSAIALYEMRIKPGSYGFDTRFEAIVKARAFSEAPNLIIRENYTGISSIDYGLSFLVAAFLPGVAGFSREFQVQQIYFLFSFFPLITIYNIEAGRNSLKGTLASYHALWALLYQTVGGAVIIPLYCFALLWKSTRPQYYSIEGRNMSPTYHKALVPALLLGYLLPTVAMYLPFSTDKLHLQQGLVALWQICPLLVNLLLALFSTIFSMPSTTKSRFPNITFLYGISAVTAAFAHFYLLYMCFLGFERLSLLKVLLPRSEMLGGRATDTLHYMFNIDYVIIFGASLLWALVEADNVSRIRQVNIGLLTLSVSLTIHSIILGPAATIAALWWWRERLLLKCQKKRTV